MTTIENQAVDLAGATATAQINERFVTAHIRTGRARQDTDTATAAADAQAIAALFTKATKAKGTYCSTYHRYDGVYYNFAEGIIGFTAKLAADGVNGGVNETGLKRWAAFQRQCAALGIELEIQEVNG
jgi:hypothetical protein